MHNDIYDIVVIGSGPGGSSAAIRACQHNFKTLIIERETFPRFHIGESLTGIAAMHLQELGLSEKMNRLGFPVKTGVKVIGKDAKSEFFVPTLVDTWQVRRPEYDEMLRQHALQKGACFACGEVCSVDLNSGEPGGILQYQSQDGKNKEVRFRWLIDASGMSCFLSKQGVAGPKVFDKTFDNQVSFFSQFRHAERDPGIMGDNTFLFYSKTLHWAWFIPLSDTLTSVGVILPNETIRSLPAKDPASVLAWGIDNINTDLKRRLSGLEPTEPVRRIANFSYSVSPFAGRGWTCVGDSHQFIDPIFSFGVSYAMTEGMEAIDRVKAVFDEGDWQKETDAYTRFCNTGQGVASDLIRYFWKYPVFFGYQSRGSLKNDFIRLLGSDCHRATDMSALKIMRETLSRSEDTSVCPPARQKG